MNYITSDELGIVEIRCMNCGLPVAVRSYVTLKVNSVPPREEKILTMKRLDSWQQKRLNLEGGAYSDVIVCSDCVDLDLDPEKMERAIRDGWIYTWQHEKKSNKEIAKLVRTLPKAAFKPKKKTAGILIDETGKKYDRLNLVVIKRAANNKQGRARWFCRCDCGKTITVSGYNLRAGLVKSCGHIGKPPESKKEPT